MTRGTHGISILFNPATYDVDEVGRLAEIVFWSCANEALFAGE
jgi:hypothetical protein